MEITSAQEQIKNSRCFGIAYDEKVKECKVCEVAKMCQKQMESGVVQVPSRPAPASKKNISMSDEAVESSTLKPATPRPVPKSEPAKPEKKTTKKAAEKEQAYADDMPVFKDMEMDDLIALAEERGLKMSDFDKYTKEGIKRMRITMALKKTYAV